MTDFETTTCLVCASKEYETYSKKGQFGLITNVVICKNCGFSYLNPRWTKQRYHTFYTKEYDTYYRPEVIKKNYVYDAATSIKNILHRNNDIIDFKKNDLNILDVGTGMGDSLFYLKNQVNTEAKYFAIESSEFCVKHLEQNGISVISNDVDSNWELSYKEKFDVIIMRHVLEHFLDPVAILKKINFILKPTGVLYIAVPNAKKPTKPLLAHFFRVVHVSYFSSLSFTNAFSLSGFTAIKMAEGDSFDKHEIFAFCKKSPTSPITINKNESIIQKGIYNQYRKRELYYRFKNFIAKNIILRFK